MRYLLLLLFLTLLTQALDPELSPPEASRLQALEALAETQPGQAAEALAASLTDTSSPAMRYALALFQHQAGASAQAIASLEQAIAQAPGFTRARRLLATLLYNEKRYQAALPHLQVLLTDAPSGSDWQMLAWTLIALDEPSAAETAIRQAQLFQPADPELQRALLQTLVAQGREPEATALARRLLRNDPGQKQLWQVRLQAALAAGDTQRALLHLQAMRHLGLADARGLLMLGDLLLDQRLHDEAIAAYLYANALQPDASPDRLLRAAQALIALGRKDDAGALLPLLANVSADLAPADRARHLSLQAALASDPTAAVALHRQAVAAAPTDGYLLLQAAAAIAEAGHAPDARPLYTRAIRLGQPFALHAHLALARLDVDANDLESAIRNLQQAQEIEPTPGIARYLQSLQSHQQD